MVVNLKNQFSKTRLGTQQVYLSKYKHNTQGKGKVLSHNHMGFNLKSQFSKLESVYRKNIEASTNKRLRTKENYWVTII